MTCAVLGCQCALLLPTAVSLADSLEGCLKVKAPIASPWKGLTVRYDCSPCITDLVS